MEVGRLTPWLAQVREQGRLTELADMIEDCTGLEEHLLRVKRLLDS